MIPSSLLGVVLFVAAVGPGYLYVRKAEQYSPPEKRTPLREAAELLVIGALTSLIAATVVFVAARAAQVVNSQTLDREGGNYVVLHPFRSLGGILVALILSYSLALLAAHLQFRKKQVAHERGSVWWKALTSVNSREVWATVELLDGRRIQGRVDAFDMSPGDKPRDLSLAGPLKLAVRGRDDAADMAGKRIVVCTDHIRYVSVD